MEKIAIRYRRFPLGLTWTTLYFFTLITKNIGKEEEEEKKRSGEET